MCLGMPAKVVEITCPTKKLAIVELGGERRQVHVGTLAQSPEEVSELLGASVMVHLGFATQRLTEAEAEASRALLLEIQEVHRLLQAKE
ncbi:MAG: HypC/HybG/HupF family hydrogenase formation chaperone [Myxococcota bacterium]